MQEDKQKYNRFCGFHKNVWFDGQTQQALKDCYFCTIMESFIYKSPNDHICLLQENKIKCKRFTKMLFTKNMVCEAQSTDLDGFFYYKGKFEQSIC